MNRAVAEPVGVMSSAYVTNAVKSAMKMPAVQMGADRKTPKTKSVMSKCLLIQNAQKRNEEDPI